MDKPVTPVSRSFFEELEMLVLEKKRCEIIFRSENGGRTVIRDRIDSLYEEDGRGWLRTGSGLIFSLEMLEQADGMIPSNYC